MHKQKTYGELLDGIKELKKEGWVKTHRKGNTGIGKTLEDMLEVEENNFDGPDGVETELKAGRKNASSMLTLFTKSPLPRGINSKLRHEYGYLDKKHTTKKVLRTTVDSVSFNKVKGKEGFKIISEDEKIILRASRPPKCFPDMEEAYWPKSAIENSISKKYADSLLYVKADSRGDGSDEEFHFNEAWLLRGFDFGRFSKQLAKGLLKVDIRLGLYEDGRPHDHGTGVRIQPSLLDQCFKTQKKVI